MARFKVFGRVNASSDSAGNFTGNSPKKRHLYMPLLSLKSEYLTISCIMLYLNLNLILIKIINSQMFCSAIYPQIHNGFTWPLETLGWLSFSNHSKHHCHAGGGGCLPQSRRFGLGGAETSSSSSSSSSSSLSETS